MKSCFVIGPIGKADSDTRKRSDTLLRHIFTPALQPLGYDLVRADTISEPGSITIQILDRILQADLVIADLTDHNPNVFYELAVRHALRKGVIHVICDGQSIPFDVADLRTVNIVQDIPGAATAILEITAQAKRIEAGELGQTPIGLANVLTRSDSNRDDNAVLLREMVDRVSELSSVIRELGKAQELSTKQLRLAIQVDENKVVSPRHSEIRDQVAKLITHFDRDQFKRFMSLSKKGQESALRAFARFTPTSESGASHSAEMALGIAESLDIQARIPRDKEEQVD